MKSKPFPWQCPKCLEIKVEPARIDFSLQARYDGGLYTVNLKDLMAPVCSSCGERVFTNETDDAVRAAMREELRLLSPGQIETAIRKLGVKQNVLAARLGVPEETVARWVDGSLLQTRAMDNLLRAYFALPQLRAALTGADQDPNFGTSVLIG